MRRFIHIRRGAATVLTVAFLAVTVLPVWAENEITDEELTSSSMTSSEGTNWEETESSTEVILPTESGGEDIGNTSETESSSDITSGAESTGTTESGNESFSESGLEEGASSAEDSAVLISSAATLSSKPSNSSRYMSPTPTISPEWNDELNAIYNNACDWLKQRQDGELFFIAMGCAGRSIDSKQYGTFLGTVSESTYTELYPLALTAINATFCGVQATNVNGTDLITQIVSFPDLQSVDAKALSYALIALDSNPYQVPNTVRNPRQSFVNALLALQKENGSFAATDDTDILSMTSIALAALSGYSSDSHVRDALNNGVSYLQQQYRITGFQNEKSIVISRVITALTCLKININDSRFTRNGGNLCDRLLGYLDSDGGFKQSKRDDASDSMSTESAIIALTSVKYFTSPYVTRQSLPETTASSSDQGENDFYIDWHWWLLPPIVMIVAGVVLGGMVVLRKRNHPEETAEAEKE